MGFFTKDIKMLDDLFVHTLRDIYYAEQQIAKSVPDMIAEATDQTLKNGFETHLAETIAPPSYSRTSKRKKRQTRSSTPWRWAA